MSRNVTRRFLKSAGRFVMHLRGARGFVCACAVLLSGPSFAAGPVIVLRASETPPYKLVESAFGGALGQPTKSVSAATGDVNAIAKTALSESPALVFAIGASAAKAIADASPTSPLLYALVPNPARAGLKAQVPGVSMFASPQSQLRAIKALLPNAKRVGILFDPKLTANEVAELEKAASGAGLSLVKKSVDGAQQVAGAAREVLGKCDVLLLIPDTTVVSGDTFKFIAQASLEAKIPLVGFSQGMAKAGAVLAVEVGYDEIGKRAAGVAKKILAGASVGAESPDGAVVLNTKSAQLLGIAVPASLKASAAKVFE
ncbi:MAG: ABC transporter substrate-binding protein [Myxococcaceae bacterium]